MLKALQLIFEPSATWEAITHAGRSCWQVILLYSLPTLLIASAIELWGLHKLGNQPSTIAFSHRAPTQVAEDVLVRYGLSQTVLILAMLFLLPLLMQILFKSMHGKTTYANVLIAVAYSFAPYFLMMAIDALPFVNTWICRGIGAVLVAKVFYVGLVRVVKPEPTTALGAYLVGTFLIAFFIALTHFVSLRVLEDGLLAHLW